jgi:proline iminopeptidase
MDPQDLEKMKALIHNSKAKICENGSHCAFFDDSETYFDTIRAFLNEVENH